MKIEIGLRPIYEIRREYFNSGNCSVPFKIAYLSDLHLNKKSGAIIDKLLTDLGNEKPQFVLLGGDYVDFTGGYKHLKRFCQEVSKFLMVFAILGNHDLLRKKELLDIFNTHKIVVLPKNQTLFIEQFNLNLTTNPNAPINQEKHINLLLLHQPKHLKVNPFDLTLAGHLHGGQIVWWRNEKGLYPGKLFYKMNFLKQVTDSGGIYLISKGLGDTLPIRYNCKKDFLIINIDIKT